MAIKDELKKSWERSSELAVLHREETTRLNSLCEKYYGRNWDSFPSLADDHDIIETLDYGTAGLSFEEFDVKVNKAIKRRMR